MSSYSRLILISLFIVIFSGCATTEPSPAKVNGKYDTMLLMALDYELTRQNALSSQIYQILYTKTNNLEYLKRAITQTILASDYKTLKQLCIENLDKYPALNERYYRLAVMSSLQLKQFDEALVLAKELLKKYNSSMSYEIMGNVYYDLANYKEAVKYFESAYISNKKPSTLISLVDILYSYLKEKKKAISYLETYILTYGCNEFVCNKLITIYREEQNVDGMIVMLKKAYKEYKKPNMRYKILSILMAVLEQKDINEAILFLEENDIDDIKLFTLYEQSKNYKKALKLARKIYKKTKNKEILGQIAILEFEMATDEKSRKEVMKHVVANFELALTVSKNPSYKNYYGYLLIDYDMDIKKGLKLVSEALKVVPNNWAFMDSVAWGHYKLKNCDEAYKYMKKLVEQIGLDNDEIKQHWKKIQECKK